MYTPPTDKLLHFAAGALAACGGALLALLFAKVGYSAGPALLATAVCTAAALGREGWNLRQGGRFDWRDIAATLAGGAMVIVPVSLT